MTSHPLEGVTRILNLTVASAGAGATNLNLRPAAGRIWELLFAMGYNDDGAVVHAWLMTDPDTAAGIISSLTASAAFDPLFLGLSTATSLVAQPVWFGPPILTYDRYLTYQFVASAGSKNGVIRAIVKEFRGVAAEV